MPLVSTSIPNLLNGVSQQPSALRQVTQGETQTNALSSVIDGLIKRPPTEHLAKVNASSVSSAAVHLIDRGPNQRHVLVIEANAYTPSITLNMFDVDGNSVPVKDASGTTISGSAYTGTFATYLAAANPETDLNFLTVADYTFLLNNQKAVNMESATVPGSLITSSKYQGFDDLPVETSTHHVGDGNTNRFPVGFNFHDSSDVTVKVNGTTYYETDQVTNPDLWYAFDNDDKTLVFGGTSPNPPNYAAIEISLDPTVGDIIEVIGDEGNAFDSFYVKSVSKSAYEETVKPGIKYEIQKETMPVALTPNLSGTTVTHFTLDWIDWNDRTVGDEDSAPEPSFVDKKISNMFFYKNRLGFLSDENVIFSAAGDFFRFFPKTVTTVLDDGPIDVSASHTKVSLLKHAISFNESLTLFSNSTQFRIENAGNLTPKTISIIPTTEFENDTSVAPVGAGKNLYFSSKRGEYSSIREYYIQSEAVITDALELTAHVPEYIPKNLVKMASSSNEDILACLSSEDRTKLYIYKWFTDGQQKLQSSWSEWVMPTGSTILDVEVVESDMYLVISRSDGVFLEKIGLQHTDDTGLSINVRADRKTSLTGSYNAGTNTTTWTLPYEHSGDIFTVKSGSWPNRKGVDIVNSRPSSTTVAATGDYSSQPVLVGVPYDMSYTFSTQHVREKGGAQSILSGRLQLRTMRVNFENTGYFTVKVSPESRPTNEYKYAGVILNKANSILEEVVLSDGTFRFPVQSRNDRVSISVESSSYLPCNFQNAEWEGFYTIRSQRI